MLHVFHTMKVYIKKKKKKNLGYVQISHLIMVFFFQKSYLNNNFSIYIKQYYDYII